MITTLTLLRILFPAWTLAVPPHLGCPNYTAVTDRAPFDPRDMALHQNLFPQVQSLRFSKEMRIVTQKVWDLDLFGDAATGMLRPLVPRNLCLQISTTYTVPPTQACRPPSASWPPGTYGKVGPLPSTKGFTHLFTVMDRLSVWSEAIPIAATTTVDCANALFQGWVSRV